MIELMKELYTFMKQRKKLWLMPIIIIMLALGFLLVFVEGSAIAPFVYTLF